MTPNEVIKYLNNLAKFIKEGEQEMQVLVSNAMTGVITGRIFNNIQGSKDENNESLGYYSTSYAKQKAKKYGESLATKVNLYATGTLFGSVKQVRENDNVYIAVTDVNYQNVPPKTKKKKDGTTYTTKGSKGTDTIKVAEHLEKQYGEIFAPTTEEEEEAIDIATKYALERAEKFKP